MNKVIKFKLNKDDEFFRGLKAEFLNKGSLGIGGSFDLASVAGTIVNGVLLALKSETEDKKPDFEGYIKYSFEKKEDVHPKFYHIFEEFIDVALNRRIHTATLESVLDIVIDFMVETANKQKEIKINPPIDTNHELNAIVEHLTQTWDGFDKVNVNDFVAQVWSDSLVLTRNNFDRYELGMTKLVEVWNSERKDYDNWVAAGTTLSETEFKTAIFNDAISQLSYRVLIGSMNLTDIIMDGWDYEKNARFLMTQAKVNFPEVTKLKPKGWKELAKNYSDFDGMEQFDAKAIPFKGTNSGTASSGPFEVRVGLPYVMYDDKCQGRKPLEVLVGAILAHAYVVSERNNSSKMMKEWLEVKDEFSKPEYYKDIITDLDLKLKEPLNQALYELMLDKENKEEKVRQILSVEPENKKRKNKP